jgi:SagB-type dehydrogenase family enzyme
MRHYHTFVSMCQATVHIILILGTRFSMASAASQDTIQLPEARTDGNTSVEQALLTRRSVRSSKDALLDLAEISQLVWSAQGITSARGFRTSPSAGALYPLELYVVAGRVKDLPSAIYKYKPCQHALVKIISGDKRSELSQAALRQGAIKRAPAALLFSAVYERTTGKYGQRGIRYVHMEVGHAAQNVCLQAKAFGLQTVVIGAFRDSEVKNVAHLPANEHPLYFVPVGR